MRTTYVPPLTAETAKEIQRRLGQQTATAIPTPTATAQPAYADLATKPPKCEVLLVGFDFGTNASCIKAAYLGSSEIIVNETVPTVVGYAKDGIVDNLLPGNAKVLFGQQALANRMYLRMLNPMRNGVVEDMAAARDFVKHIRQLITVPPEVEVRAVVGLPATADRAAYENLARVLTGFFHKISLIPEPFLAALGYRDESRLSEANYLDPVRNSLFIDIGAGTSDVSLVQGYFPTADDQISIPFAGDRVDALLQEAIRRSNPDVNLPLAKIREIKEKFSYVGTAEQTATVNLVIAGKMRKLELTEAIGQSCTQLLLRVFECAKTLIAQASTETVTELLQNIVLTGGGSRIHQIDSELQRLLAEDGFERPRVLKVGDDYKEHVAKGALAAARQAKEAQWQSLVF